MKIGRGDRAVRTALAVVLLSALGACGGGGSKPSSSAAAAADATLKIRDQAAELRAKAATTFAGATDGQALALGDTVKTNGTGFAQVNYRDGSLTRIDANGQFTLTDLSTAAQAQRVAGTLDGGRAWSNVQKVTSSDSRYEIDTSVATASVRGTRFNTDCTSTDGSCSFTVVEGTVTVTPKGGTAVDLGPNESLTVHSDSTVTSNPTLTPEQLLTDSWIAKNIRIDATEALRSNSASSSSSSSSGATKAIDPCTLSPGDIQSVIGLAVENGKPDGPQICRYFPIPNPDQIAVVDVVVRPAGSSLASIRSQMPSEYLIEDVPGLGDGAFYADGTPNGYLIAIRGATEYDVDVSSQLDPDTGEPLEDTATRRAHAVALMQKLLSR
jgi:uncharacterized cupin superfamily protein